jgi:hypothetical protein
MKSLLVNTTLVKINLADTGLTDLPVINLLNFSMMKMQLQKFVKPLKLIKH